MAKPAIGDPTSGRITLPRIPSISQDANPTAAANAPSSPPIRA